MANFFWAALETNDSVKASPYHTFIMTQNVKVGSNGGRMQMYLRHRRVNDEQSPNSYSARSSRHLFSLAAASSLADTFALHPLPRLPTAPFLSGSGMDRAIFTSCSTVRLLVPVLVAVSLAKDGTYSFFRLAAVRPSFQMRRYAHTLASTRQR